MNTVYGLEEKGQVWSEPNVFSSCGHVSWVYCGSHDVMWFEWLTDTKGRPVRNTHREAHRHHGRLRHRSWSGEITHTHTHLYRTVVSIMHTCFHSDVTFVFSWVWHSPVRDGIVFFTSSVCHPFIHVLSCFFCLESFVWLLFIVLAVGGVRRWPRL